ncbi:MacB-like periplasmic core domain protein [uncultured archaeon]|nr:MacB-like periplasmic core domain protein [uncultured archaeon]
MKLNKCFKHAFNMVLHSKLRSWLTITGIVIGVAAVIAIVSIGDGMQQSLNAQLNALGGDIVTISPGFERGGGMFGMRGGGGGSSGPQATTKEIVLGRSDLQALKGLPDIALIDTNIRGSVDISYLGKTGKVSVTGVDQGVWSQITTSKIKTGRMLDSADQNVIVIGGRLASSYFDQPVGINKMITINGSAFRVVGILDDQSNSVYMPIQMAYQMIPDKTNDIYYTLVVKIRDENQLDEVITKIENKLMTARHVTTKSKDFSVSSRKEMQQARADTMNSMNTFLLAIAAVSLIVGSIGIANTMFTSVLEKTKEIGIMKAIGARNHDILLIFLFNAAFIGLVGGIIGIMLGTLLSGFMPALMGGLPMARGTAIVTLNSIFMALSVSVTVGILAGIIPAYQASKLKPVDALRYE